MIDMNPLMDQRIYNRRGAQIPKDYVVTPGGYRHKSLVRRAKKGVYLRRRENEIEFVDRSSDRIYDRELFSDLFILHPQLGSGWITCSEWNIPTSVTLKRIYAKWIVPDPPVSGDSGQTIFLFNALQNDSRNEIVQPVLQFGHSAAGGGWGWWIGNWYVASSGLAIPSLLRPVSSGITVTGVVTLISQSNGKYTYISQFLNYPEIDWIVSEIDEMTWVSHTLEAYQISTNDDFPASPYTSMTSIEIDLHQSSLSSIPWTVSNPYLANGQRSNVSNPNNPGGEIDIFYR